MNRIQPDGKVRCEICPRQCTLNDGGLGACKTRAGGGKLPFYGYISSAAVDPIEKKPLFHYRPGENIFSIGFTGCNMRCPFCQNWHISQTTDTAAQMIPPEEIITKTTALGLKQIAYTYTEPLIHLEYLIDCMTLARARGIANVLVTNGCVTPKAAAAIMPLTDAVNVDLKCFSESKYQKILGGSLSAVKHFIKASSSAGVHTEITTLIVPDFNDSEQEIDRCIDFIASISNNIPWHISAYHPAYKWTTPPTKPETILAIKKHAKQKLLYCYTGNIIDDDNDTFCANCDSVLLRRDNYKIKKLELVKKNEDGIYYCGQCGAKTPLQY
ncbi:MAG: AmmeMemoRadiSam system radical SAM enzyme [Spirochaetaceae bacterium]|nr:AmmeMemoRadiSam system radical SAM enzyme [Spirochaetaceae bacterium]